MDNEDSWDIKLERIKEIIKKASMSNKRVKTITYSPHPLPTGRQRSPKKRVLKKHLKD